MAETTTVAKENLPAQEQTPQAVPKKSTLGKAKIMLFVGLVVAVECVIAYLYLPSAAETAALAGSAVSGDKESKPLGELEEKKEENAEVEVDLGEFNVTAYQPASNSTLRIDFHLYGTVASGDQKAFAARLEENQHRFREQVLVTVRGSEITDLTDAGLGLIKRKIMDKTNRMLGKPFLQAVIFSDFSFIEQ
jgi:flagellar basal body-associated protein FliL